MVTATRISTRRDPRARAFLGREFLTWLWYRCESSGGTFTLTGTGPGNATPGGLREVGVLFNDYVALVSADETGERNIVRRASAHRSPEARTALLVGKTVEAARLEIACGEREWSAVIAGDTLDVRSAKYPAPRGETADDRELDRLAALEELSDIIDGLYALFLAARLDAAWDSEEVPAIARWIRSRAIPA